MVRQVKQLFFYCSPLSELLYCFYCYIEDIPLKIKKKKGRKQGSLAGKLGRHIPRDVLSKVWEKQALIYSGTP